MNEDKTSIEKLANMNLEGLLLPDPTPVSYWWLWVLIACFIVVVTWLWRKKYRAPKATALRELKQLHRNLEVNKDDPKSIKKQIALSLCQGFEVTRLDNVMPDNIQWREYLNTLERSLYSNETANGNGNNNNEPETLLSLIKSAQSWLRKDVQS